MALSAAQSPCCLTWCSRESFLLRFEEVSTFLVAATNERNLTLAPGTCATEVPPFWLPPRPAHPLLRQSGRWDRGGSDAGHS